MIRLGNGAALVTGALGWLGRALVEALARGLPDVPRLREPDYGLRIRALVVPGQDATELAGLSERVEVVVGDLRNAGDCARLCRDAAGAVLFHTAGVIHPRRVREFYETNVTGTANLLNTACAAGVRRAVMVSSNSPCGCNPHPDHLFDEESPYHPYMNYGRSKMRMELAVREAGRSGRIETVIVRPPWFYGPFQPRRQTLFFEMIRDGKVPVVGCGENRRSMGYIDNVAQGLILAASTAQAAGHTYWIADRQPYTMNEIVDTVERLLETEFGQACAHKRIRLPGITADLARVADRALQGLGFYNQKIHVLSEMNQTIACSIGKAQRELGYEPAVELEEGMRRSLRWVCGTAKQAERPGAAEGVDRIV
jgi:nucleoside-diphosphate-sugar epimerase